MVQQKIIFNWSGGKDSALALHRLHQQGQYEIISLFTSIHEEEQRISMHGVRRELLLTQASRLKLPLQVFQLPQAADMQVYEQLMEQALQPLLLKGATAAAFGDIFLEDIKQYREKQLLKAGLQAIFPLWGMDTGELMNCFIKEGFKALITCVNEKYLDKSFAGRNLDEHFLKDLPSGVDPCGENGEFHSFVYDGPLFELPVAFKKGDVVYKKYNAPDGAQYDTGFWFCDLLPT